MYENDWENYDWDNLDEDGNPALIATEESIEEVKDSKGTILQNGDSVYLIKDLNAKKGGTLKRGTVFKNIRLMPDAHEQVESKVGKATYALKAEYVTKK